jgi:hypothetical protein
MTQTNYLRFNDNRTEVTVVYGKDETPTYTTKKAAMEAIVNLARAEKIEVKDFTGMRNEILRTEQLPWGGEAQDEEPTEIPPLMFMAILAAILRGGMGNRYDSMFTSGTPTEIAQLIMCPFCRRHGEIHLKVGRSNNLATKEEALAWMEKHRTEMTEEDYQKVSAEIEASTLPNESRPTAS